MSVLKRNRSMSPLEFLNLAIKIRANIINLVMNEKYVAKRWRPVITFPMCDMAHGLIKNIRTANSIIPFRNSENKYNTQEANERLHCKFYGRYMDDIYIIDDSKEHLKEILCEIKNICSLYEITINSEKTNIVKLSHGFTFLKTKFNLLGTGKILKRLERNNVTRMRRKLKKLKAMKDRGEITMPEIENSYRSWQGYASHKNSHKTVIEMEKLYQKLFEEA